VNSIRDRVRAMTTRPVSLKDDQSVLGRDEHSLSVAEASFANALGRHTNIASVPYRLGGADSPYSLTLQLNSGDVFTI
jgi:hypothetical protein